MTRETCHVSGDDCLNPAGYRTPRGYSVSKPTTSWTCPACGNVACAACRRKVGKETVCLSCLPDELRRRDDSALLDEVVTKARAKLGPTRTEYNAELRARQRRKRKARK